MRTFFQIISTSLKRKKHGGPLLALAKSKCFSFLVPCLDQFGFALLAKLQRN